MLKQISYVSSAGNGAVCFDALDALPEPDAQQKASTRHTREKSSDGVFVPQCDADEIAHAIIENGAARYGFGAADVLALIVGDYDEKGDMIITDCYHEAHNAGGRRQMFAKNGCPGSHGASYGCLDDQCPDHTQGSEHKDRFKRLLSTGLQAGVVDLENLPDFFADEAAKFAVARILFEAGKSGDTVPPEAGAEPDIDWSADQPSIRFARVACARSARYWGGR